MIKPGSYLDRVFVNFSLRREDEIAALVVHIVGFGLHMIMAALLIVFAAIKQGSATQIVSFSIYSFLFILYYIFSVLFHALDKTKPKKIFRILELNSKYLLFWGVAIPLTLVIVGGDAGWIFFAIFTALNIAGIIVTSLNRAKSSSLISLINTLVFLGLIIFLAIYWQNFATSLILWLSISFALLLLGIFFDNLAALRFHHALSHFCYFMINLAIFWGFLFGIVLL